MTDIPLIEIINVGDIVYIKTNAVDGYCATRISVGTPAISLSYFYHDLYGDCTDCINLDQGGTCIPVVLPPGPTATPTGTPGPTATPTPTPTATSPTPLSLFDDAEIRFFMVFGKELYNDPVIFIEEVISVVNKPADKNNWRQYLQVTIGLNQFLSDNLTLLKKYKNSKDALDKFFKDFENGSYYQTIKEPSAFKPYDLTKERIFNYLVQSPTVEADSDRLDAIYNKQSKDTLFNLKKSFISE